MSREWANKRDTFCWNRLRRKALSQWRTRRDIIPGVSAPVFPTISPICTRLCTRRGEKSRKTVSCIMSLLAAKKASKFSARTPSRLFLNVRRKKKHAGNSNKQSGASERLNSTTMRQLNKCMYFESAFL